MTYSITVETDEMTQVFWSYTGYVGGISLLVF